MDVFLKEKRKKKDKERKKQELSMKLVNSQFAHTLTQIELV